MKIGRLICRNDKDYVYSSKRPDVFELEDEPTEDILIVDKEFKKVFI